MKAILYTKYGAPEVEKLQEVDKPITKVHEVLYKNRKDVLFNFDAVGKSSFRKCKPLLKEKGIYISTDLGKNAENIFLALTTPIWGRKKVLFPLPSISKEDVLYLKDLVEKGFYKPVIDRYYTLDQIVEAYQYVESGKKTGNVIINIADY